MQAQRAGFLGVISDTHGQLRPQALAALRGAELIVHAGDIGGESILEGLREVAPLIAVPGNNDYEPYARAMPELTEFHYAGLSGWLIHDLARLRALGRDPAAEGVDLVVGGHSHRQLWELRDGVRYLNPGSAGPRRFTLPISLARVERAAPEAAPSIEFVDLVGNPAND